MAEFDELVPAASFPVVLFDGEHEIDIGNVLVHPSLGFKRFQTIISQKIGISPNQISTSLVRRKKARSSPEIRRKVPIDESSDFAAIARERDCFVLVILKRSRRRRSRRRGGGAAFVELAEQKVASISPEKTILKRYPAYGSGVDVPFGGNSFQSAAGLGLWDYDGQLQNLRKERQQYQLSTKGGRLPYVANYLSTEAPQDSGMLGWLRPATPPAVWEARSVVCEECFSAKEEGRSPAFHRCVYDAVTVGFRSAVGPIQRPPKKHIEASS